MARELFELVGANDRRFSPYCWRVRLALAHKGLEATLIPVGFTEKDKVAFSGQGLVPVLRDGETVVSDSWDIACYLEEAYPDAPSLFGGPVGFGLARFFQEWVPAVGGSIMQVIMKDIHDRARPQDQAYFRESREKRTGKTLEEIHAVRDTHGPAFEAATAPLRGTLAKQPFLSGERPAYPDYIVFSHFQTARLMSPAVFGDPAGALDGWRERMLDLYDGMARAAPACSG